MAKGSLRSEWRKLQQERSAHPAFILRGSDELFRKALIGTFVVPARPLQDDWDWRLISEQQKNLQAATTIVSAQSKLRWN